MFSDDVWNKPLYSHLSRVPYFFVDIYKEFVVSLEVLLSNVHI